jgi:hypothetical protein
LTAVAYHCFGKLQENVYNPYYAFVCQHLCRTSHSYKITLQFCLWDFLRDLGEDSVGGAEVIKNLKGNGDESEVKDVSSTKMRNVAKAYAWWIANDCVTVTIFKVCSIGYSSVRVTELPLAARGLYSAKTPNTQLSLAPLSPAFRKQPGIDPNFEW